MRPPFVLGVTGWSGSGKTVLVERLIPQLNARGLTVSTVKHAHHAADVDRPGKDSYRHREAGAVEVMLATERRWALMREHPPGAEPPLSALLARLAPVDIVLVEGFKRDRHPKIEVRRAALATDPIWPRDPSIVAVASDGPIEGCRCPVLDLDDLPAIATFVVDLQRAASQAAADGMRS
jgi:molybdopterin-guanine dinucleotide biosynthesis protein B